MPSRSLTIEQVLTLLAAPPPRIAALTAGLAPAHLHTSPNHDAWSANDVLAHLRACADVWGTCIAAMIIQDTPTLRAINPTTWIKQTDDRDLDFRSSLHPLPRSVPSSWPSWNRCHLTAGHVRRP